MEVLIGALKFADRFPMTSSEEIVIGQIREVFANKGQTSPPLGPETALDRSLGLESLDFAELAIRLEQTFGKDPFASSAPSLATIADLAALYQK
jgi:acyl carrier protein